MRNFKSESSYEGFQKLVRSAIPVEVDHISTVNLELKPGEVTQTVTVTGEPVLANTTNATLGQLITTKTLESMPLNGRNVYLLVQLTPGVVPINGAVNQTGADPLFYESITRGQNVVLADNLTLTPTTLLQVRGSFTRHAEDQPVPGPAQNYDITKLGFPASVAQHQVIQTIPYMAISGMLGVGSRVPSIGFKFISYNYDGSVIVDTIRGRHQLKMGFEYQKAFINMGQPVAPSGQYQFDTTATSSRTFAGDGFGYASFLLGMGTPTTANNFTIDSFIAHASPYYASFIQDSIRVTRNLTINLGLRWEISAAARNASIVNPCSIPMYSTQSTECP